MQEGKLRLHPRRCDLPECGVVFTPTRPGQRFHTIECKKKYHTKREIYRERVKCPFCNETFKIKVRASLEVQSSSGVNDATQNGSTNPSTGEGQSGGCT